MRTGKVINFGNKGYGFVRDLETQKQYFVHIKDVAGRRDLKVGQVVKFEIGPETARHSQQAIRVNVVASPDRHDVVRR